MTDIENPHRHGVWYAVAAFGSWGFFPLYFKLMEHLSPIEVVAWRCVWSFCVMAMVLTVMKRWNHFLDCFRTKRKLGHLILSMMMITSNWGLFVYAVSSHQVLQSSLAYFINPLVSVLLGVAFLHERLRPIQIVSIALATVGVVTMTVLAGGFPSLAILLAVTFGLYGYLHKTVKGVDSMTGLTVEVGLATPPSLFLIFYLKQSGLIPGLSTVPLTGSDFLLLASTGFMTTVPLIFFITAAHRLPLSMVGMIQYLTPTLHFVLAVFAFGEPFTEGKLYSFLFIWVAVALFLYDSQRKRPAPPV